MNSERKERRGFASMSPEKQREIASKGGRAAHEKGTAHEWTADEARSAGRKGGQVSRGGRGRLVVPAESPSPSPTLANPTAPAGFDGLPSDLGGLDGGEELLDGHAFEEVGLGSGLECAEDVFVAVEGGEHDEARGGGDARAERRSGGRRRAA